MIEGHFEVRRAGLLRKQWRWNFVSTNGRKIYGSTESYKNKNDCVATIPRLYDQPRQWREYYD